MKNHMQSNHLMVESDAKNPIVDFETHNQKPIFFINNSCHSGHFF